MFISWTKNDDENQRGDAYQVNFFSGSQLRDTKQKKTISEAFPSNCRSAGHNASSVVGDGSGATVRSLTRPNANNGELKSATLSSVQVPRQTIICDITVDLMNRIELRNSLRSQTKIRDYRITKWLKEVIPYSRE